MSAYRPTTRLADLPPLPEDAPTVVSTFAGTGGSSLGYRLAGFKMRLAVEWDDCAASCYRANYPDTPLYHGDIGALSDDDALRMSGLEPGELDVFDGSPPCQGFSTVGRRDMDDSRNQLFREYARLLRAFRPRAFVMENVSGMVKGKMVVIFAEILRELKACGYRVSARLLNAMYFGVPQSRQRMIILGVREDLGIDPSHPRAMTRPIPLRDVLPSLAGGGFLSRDTGNRRTERADEPSPTLTVGSPHHFRIEHPAPPEMNDKYGQLWDRVPVGGDAGDVLNGSGFSNCVKPDPDRPSPTLPKTQTGRGFATVAHPTIRRALTIEEALIIGGFPDDFALDGSYAQRWARIGNSVPPPLMAAVAAHIRESVLRR